MKSFIDWFTNEESGQGMVEYGLIIALVALVACVGLSKMGGGLNKLFTGTENGNGTDGIVGKLGAPTK